MINNDEKERLTKLNFIQATRQSDGAKIRAKRLVIDSETPIRWNVILVDNAQMYIFNEIPMFEDTDKKVQKQYSTSDLFSLAQKAGFTNWQQIPSATWEGFELVGNEYKLRHLLQYELPDPTPNKID